MSTPRGARRIDGRTIAARIRAQAARAHVPHHADDFDRLAGFEELMAHDVRAESESPGEFLIDHGDRDART